MSTWAKYQLDQIRLRQARKAIPGVTWRLPLGYCQNPGELVLSEGRNYKLFFVLLEANLILPMTPRDGCDLRSHNQFKASHWSTLLPSTSFFFKIIGRACRWRFCYRCGLPHLVFQHTCGEN